MADEKKEGCGGAEHVLRNRTAWDLLSRHYFEPGRQAWRGEARWGIWDIPEEDLHILPDVSGLDTVELGCGTAYVSAWLARRGARPVGIDSSREQLKTALTFQKDFGLDFPIIEANAEQVPLRDESFDLAISEYGASIWCEPHRWVAEAARLLRPGGRLIFMVGGTLLWLCEPDSLREAPAGTRLVHDYFGSQRFESAEDGSVEFHLGYGDWIRLLRSNSFQVLNLIEIRPHQGANTRFPYVTPDWARRWPSEEVWVARKEQV